MTTAKTTTLARASGPVPALVGRVRVAFWAWRMRIGCHFRRDTTGPKWTDRNHNVGCVWFAPDDVCICEHVRRHSAANAGGEFRRDSDVNSTALLGLSGKEN